MEEKEKKVQGENKQSNNSKVVIIVLVIAILGLVAYIGYDKLYLSKSSNETSNATESEKKELDINDFTVQKLFKIFTLSHGKYMENINDSNRARLRVAHDNLAQTDINTIRCDEIEILDSSRCMHTITDYVDSNAMKQKVEELFGSDYTYKKEDFDKTCRSYTGKDDVPCYLMHYDAKKDIYTYLPGQCGCSQYDSYKETLASAYTEGDKLYLNTTLVATFDGEPIQRENAATAAKYIFKKDAKNGNYVFEKRVME